MKTSKTRAIKLAAYYVRPLKTGTNKYKMQYMADIYNPDQRYRVSAEVYSWLDIRELVTAQRAQLALHFMGYEKPYVEVTHWDTTVPQLINRFVQWEKK
jgi:hypothetical protein